MSDESELQHAKSEAAAKARLEAERKRLADERAEHQRTLDEEAAKSRNGLTEYMEALTKTEQRQVRLHAYLHVLRGDWDMPNHLQTHLDGICLRLSRYMVEGKA